MRKRRRKKKRRKSWRSRKVGKINAQETVDWGVTLKEVKRVAGRLKKEETVPVQPMRRRRTRRKTRKKEMVAVRLMRRSRHRREYRLEGELDGGLEEEVEVKDGKG